MARRWGAVLIMAAAVGCSGGGSPPGTTTTTGPATTAPSSTTTSSSTTTTAPPSETAGLSDPSLLTPYTGPATISGGTVVIENKQITGRLTVEGGNVTIRNTAFAFEDWYHLWVKGGTVLVEHSEFDGLNTATNGDDSGVAGGGVTVRWSRFVHLVNGMNLGSNSTAEHNVIEQPNTAYGPAHSDGIEVYSGSNVSIRSNRIDIRGGRGATGCVNIATDFGDIAGVVVEGNDFTGGTYSLYVRLQGEGESVTDVRVRNNRWHTGAEYGTHSVDPRSAVAEWSGNTLDGAPFGL